MEAISYTKARSQFAGIMNQICEDHSPVIITRQNEKSVVMLSLEDFNALTETVYLMKSPKNAVRITEAVNDLQNGDSYTEVDI